jgi:hypothetical protein
MRPIAIALIAVTAFSGGYVAFPSSALAQRTPQGSFRQTCRNIRASRGVLTAQCLDHGRRWRSTSLGYAGCRGDIANHNGVLSCEGVGGRPPSQGGGGRPPGR